MKVSHTSLHKGISKLKYNYANYIQVRLMSLMSKLEYLIMPKGTKFIGLGKLGLIVPTNQHYSRVVLAVNVLVCFDITKL